MKMPIRDEELIAAKNFDQSFSKILNSHEHVDVALSDLQMDILNDLARKWRQHLVKFPRFHNIIGLTSILFLFTFNISLLYLTSISLLPWWLFLLLHGFSMYSLVIYTMHEGAGHLGIVKTIDGVSKIENIMWAAISKIIHQSNRLFFADPSYYKMVHPHHHAHANTEEDGAYSRFISIKKFLISLMPLANVLPFNDYKIHDGNVWTKSKILTLFIGSGYQCICVVMLAPTLGWMLSSVVCLILAPWFGFALDRIRESLEHQLTFLDHRANARNLGLSTPLRFLVSGGPTGQPYHFIHHLFPTLPWYAQMHLGFRLDLTLNFKQRSFFKLKHNFLLFDLISLFKESKVFFPKRPKIVLSEVRGDFELSNYKMLRSEVYSEKGKNAPRIDVEDNVCNDPEKSNIILGVYNNGTLVGGITLWMPRNNFWFTIPRNTEIFLQPNETMEIAGLFLLESYRKWHILVKIFQEVHRRLRLENRSKILIACEPKLEKIYKSIDFSGTGVYIEKMQINNKMKLQVLTSDQRFLGVWGLAVGPIKWFMYMLPTLVQSLKDTELARRIHFNVTDWILMVVYFPLTVIGFFIYAPKRKA